MRSVQTRVASITRVAVAAVAASLKDGNAAIAALPSIEDKIVYTFPAEDSILHEATWLVWPQNSVEEEYDWDPDREERLQGIWVQMAKALHTGERVRIIVSDQDQQSRVDSLLTQNGVDMSEIDFFIYPTDDSWIRDNGPIFVFDQEGNLVVENWKFNGWGEKQEWSYDTEVPRKVASDLNLPLQNIPVVNEGGSIEVDGRGTMMAKRSSILNANRNPGVTQAEVELYFKHYLGVTNFIWLDGIPDLDITDDHIDGTARFANEHTIVTHYREDFEEPSEYDMLREATDVDGELYEIVHLPQTLKYIDKLDGYGVYINYYVGNDVIIFPTFDDPNDDVAAGIIQTIYPEKTIAKINFVELYVDGGLAHCVTQQQPVSSMVGSSLGVATGNSSGLSTPSQENNSSLDGGNLPDGVNEPSETISNKNDTSKGTLTLSTATVGSLVLSLVGAWLVI